MSLLKTIAKWLDRLVVYTVIVLLVSMVVTTSAGVFWRYILNSALSWSEELGRFLLVWVSFLGAALATYRGAHIGINVIFDMLPPHVQLWLSRIVDFMIIIFMGSILLNGVKILPIVHVRVAPTLFIHMSTPYLIMPVSAGIIIFQIFVRLLNSIDKRKAEQ
ncbi:MAG: TRAP transporter small permease [Deltaproteobacteria bacterium]|nr:TRAP transporter small permease [Deltaproteobacteria bacterium]